MDLYRIYPGFIPDLSQIYRGFILENNRDGPGGLCLELPRNYLGFISELSRNYPGIIPAGWCQKLPIGASLAPRKGQDYGS